MASFINQKIIQDFPFETFKKKQPFPWEDFKDFLTTEGFQLLYSDFPSLKQFEYNENIDRKGQRPHNRYYLAYEQSIYHTKDHSQAGIITHDELMPTWQSFIEELQSEIYRSFIAQALGVKDFTIRFAWHIGKETNEVSPHRDADSKAGTHIYFNTDADWKPEWGGQILVLGGKTISGNAPDFKDFITSTAVSNMNNHSFLFKNNPNAWHGVKALSCPEEKYRKLFNVIFDV